MEGKEGREGRKGRKEGRKEGKVGKDGGGRGREGKEPGLILDLRKEEEKRRLKREEVKEVKGKTDTPGCRAERGQKEKREGDPRPCRFLPLWRNTINWFRGYVCCIHSLFIHSFIHKGRRKKGEQWQK